MYAAISRIRTVCTATHSPFSTCTSIVTFPPVASSSPLSATSVVSSFGASSCFSSSFFSSSSSLGLTSFLPVLWARGRRRDALNVYVYSEVRHVHVCQNLFLYFYPRCAWAATGIAVVWFICYRGVPWYSSGLVCLFVCPSVCLWFLSLLTWMP